MLSALQIRTNAGKVRTALSMTTSGIKTRPYPVRFMTAIDAAQAHMGNRALMHYVSQQYPQQVHDTAGNRGLQAPQRRFYQQLVAGNRALIASTESPDPYQAEIFKRRAELRRLFKKYNNAMGMPLFPFPDSVEDSIQRSYQLSQSGGWDNAEIGKILNELMILQEARKESDLSAYGNFEKFEEYIKAAHPGAWSFNDLFHHDRAMQAGFPAELIRHAACPLAKGVEYPVWPVLYAHCVDTMREAIEKNPSAEDAHVNFDSLRTERIAELIKIGNAGQFDDMTQWDMSTRLGVTEWELMRALEALGPSRVHAYSYNSKEAKYHKIALDIPDKLPQVGTPEHERLVEYFRKLPVRYAGTD